MMCFRDMTFCSSPNCKNKCGRKFTDEVQKAADKWWEDCDGEAPIALSYFCDEEGYPKR